MEYTNKELVSKITSLWFKIAKHRKGQTYGEILKALDYYTLEFYGPTVSPGQLKQCTTHILKCEPVMNKLKKLCDNNYWG